MVLVFVFMLGCASHSFLAASLLLSNCFFILFSSSLSIWPIIASVQWHMGSCPYLIKHLTIVRIPPPSQALLDTTNIKYPINHRTVCGIWRVESFSCGGVFRRSGRKSQQPLHSLGRSGDGRRAGVRFLVEGAWSACSKNGRKQGRVRASRPERRAPTDEKSSRFLR